jgi:bacterioferritin-associated ferredoxin
LQESPDPDTLNLVIVCICRGVSDRQVRLAVLNGATTIREVRAMCDAGRGCGTCHEQIEGMIAEGTCPANDNRPGACPAAVVAADAPAAANGAG